MRRIRRFGQHYPFITNRVTIYDSLIATSHIRDYYQTNTSINSLNIGSIVTFDGVYNMYKPDVNYDSNWNLVQDQKSDVINYNISSDLQSAKELSSINLNYGISWGFTQE